MGIPTSAQCVEILTCNMGRTWQDIFCTVYCDIMCGLIQGPVVQQVASLAVCSDRVTRCLATVQNMSYNSWLHVRSHALCVGQDIKASPLGIKLTSLPPYDKKTPNSHQSLPAAVKWPPPRTHSIVVATSISRSDVSFSPYSSPGPTGA